MNTLPTDDTMGMTSIVTGFMQKDSVSTNPSARIIDIANSDIMSHNNDDWKSEDVNCASPQKITKTNTEESEHSDGRAESDDDSLQEIVNGLSSKKNQNPPMTRSKRSHNACHKGDHPNSDSEDNIQESVPQNKEKQRRKW